jgi:4-amino-4-deoxy-L-arabinose transferase-like glycosyltransferase
MSRSTRAKARSRGGSIPVNSRPSSDFGSSEPAPHGRNEGEASIIRFKAIDAVLLALLLAFATLLIANAGFANGQELWPMPDAVEYAATAVNLDRGLGPVLHFGGDTYPTRYLIGYPLILAAAYPLLGHRPGRLCLVTALTALVAIAGLYLLTLWAFDRPSAILAGLLLATSPHFLGLSTCVMSDVPSLAVVILSALAFLYAEEKESLVASALCGLLAGLAVIIRVTNGALLAAMLAAALLVQPRRLRFGQVIAFAIGLAPFPGLQAWVNLHYLGSPLSNGYAFWLPMSYSSNFKPFKLSYLVVPADPTYQHGNFVTYAIAMLGLDGILGQLSVGTELRTLFHWRFVGTQLRTLVHARYALYPFPAAVFAGLGVFFALRRKRNASTIRAMYLGLGFLASLLVIYLSYFCVDPRFMLPGLFIVFAAAGYGLVSANRSLHRGGAGFAVIALDVLLAAGIAVQTVSWLAVPMPLESKLVSDVLALRPQLTNAVVLSDISLQWLELYAGGEHTEFVGLNNIYSAEVPDQAVTEYHLYVLEKKRSGGWSGPIPPILFPGGLLDSAEARKLADEDKQGRPVYALVTKPLTREWQNVLKHEAAELDRYFTDTTIADYPEVGLYQLKPH